jgi:hypothetical protein
VRRGIVLGAVLLGLGVPVPGAQASYHLMKISEVFPGTAAMGYNDAFVELQMYEAGQHLVAGKDLSFYAASGANTPFFEFPANAPNGESQRTILVGDMAVPTRDFTYDSLSGKPDILGPAGGAVCFGDTAISERVDCVAWGSFSNTHALPVGTPAAAIPDGQSLTRSIAPNCPTLLEAADDTDNSASDFSFTSPSPRSNTVTPTEFPCGPAAGGDSDPPQTKITKSPPNKTDETTVKYRFRSDEPGSTFKCKVDQRPYRPCRSPRKLSKLDDGKHGFRVRAKDPAGNVDPTPAKDRFKVVD